MPTFNFMAKDAHGSSQEGTLDAKDINEAKKILKQHNLTPVSVTPVGGVAAPKKKSVLDMKLELKMPAFLSRVKPKDLMVLTRQLATLVESGLPLLRGLRILTKQTKHPAGVLGVCGFAQNVPVKSDPGVGGKHYLIHTAPDGFALAFSEQLHSLFRGEPGGQRFVDVRSPAHKGVACVKKQLCTPRRVRSQYKCHFSIPRFM